MAERRTRGDTPWLLSTRPLLRDTLLLLHVHLLRRCQGTATNKTSKEGVTLVAEGKEEANKDGDSSAKGHKPTTSATYLILPPPSRVGLAKDVADSNFQVSA